MNTCEFSQHINGSVYNVLRYKNSRINFLLQTTYALRNLFY